MPKFGVRVLSGPRVQLVHKLTRDATGIMRKIGNYLARISRVAFRNQRFGDAIWAPKAASENAPSIMGVVQDLQVGAAIHPSRFHARPALIATGALSRSIRSEVTGPKTVRVVADEPYAKLHQEGGHSVLAVDSVVRQNLATILKVMPNLRPKLGFLFRTNSVSAEVPARPFLGAPTRAHQHIMDMILRSFGQKGP